MSEQSSAESLQQKTTDHLLKLDEGSGGDGAKEVGAGRTSPAPVSVAEKEESDIPGFQDADTIAQNLLKRKPAEEEICLLSEGKNFPLTFKEMLNIAEDMENPYLICDYDKGKYFIREFLSNDRKIKGVVLPSDMNVLNLEMVKTPRKKEDQVGIGLDFMRTCLDKQFGEVENVTIFSVPPRLSVLHR
ncbi:MAG: hypothetical protein WD335_01210 [Candidatus Paceibacterota bacterium]